MKDLRKNNNAITLIALVITIIILLILAGITIATLTENGLFEKTKQAKIENEKSQVKEELELAIFSIQSSNLNKIDINVIMKELPNEKNLDLTRLEWDSNQTDEEPLGIYKGYDFYINKDFEVIIGKKQNIDETYIYENFIMPNLNSNDCTIDGNNYKVTASSSLSGYENVVPYKAFDGVIENNLNNGCWHSGESTPQWIQIQYPFKIKINSFSIKNRDAQNNSEYEGYTVKDFKLEGSNDGENWTILGNYINQKGTLVETTFNVENSEGYYYYRWYITSSYSSYVSIGEIVLNDIKIRTKSPETIIKEIEQIGEIGNDSYSILSEIIEYYNLLSDTNKQLITNFSKLQDAVEKYNNMENEELFIMPNLNSNDCTMDGNNYKVTASSSLLGYENVVPYKAFDGVIENNLNNGCWHSGGSTPQWIQIQYPFKIKINSFSIKNRDAQNNSEYEGYTVKDFKLEGSNDGENWTILGNYINQKGTLVETTFNVENSEGYYYYRWYITSSYSSYVSIGEIILDEAYYKPTINLNK